MGSHTHERKRHGRHYTPPALARFLARRLLAHAPRPGHGGVLRVLDPACGDGELLLALHREAAAHLPGVRLRLTGYDLDESGLAAARTRAAAEHIEVDWHAGDFLADAADLADGSFDAIITNPPYVRTQQLGGDTARLLSRQYGLRGRIDLTHPFVAVAPRLLTTGGALGLLCANRFLTTKAGANIRSILLGELSPVELYDLGDTKLFAAAVLPAITIATRGGRGAVCRHVSAYEVPIDESLCSGNLFDALVADSGSLVRHNGRTFAVEVGTLSTGVPASPALRPASAAEPAPGRDEGASTPSGRSWTESVGSDVYGGSEDAGAPGGRGGAESVDSGVYGGSEDAGAPGWRGRTESVDGRAHGRTEAGATSSRRSRTESVDSSAHGRSEAGGTSSGRGRAERVDSDAHGRSEAGGASGGRGRTESVDSPAHGRSEAGATPSGRSRTESDDARAHRRSEGGGAHTAWRMSRPSVDAWLNRVGAGTWRSFGEVARIRVGIKTTADRVFISDRWDQARPCPEPELLLELITHHDLAPWRIERSADTRVLYPYDTAAPRRVPVDLREFPRAAAYLRRHRSTLAARKYVTGSGREWFEIWVPQRPNLWRVPKLVFPDISERPRFALDRSGAVVNGDCYWISLDDLGGDTERAQRLAYLLMGVANSALGLRYYDAVCGNRLYSGRRRWITQYVSRLPLPDPDRPASAEIAALIAQLVDGDHTPDDAARHRLDELVDAAFGLGSGGSADADHRQQGAPGERATGLGVAERDEPVGGQRQGEREPGHDLGDQIGVEAGVPGA
ncbi:Eco57I restriction-modification methylase domain-containing protein [Nocardia sp. bgisy134]|uniref:Eco57I restriction-modification methylase domain-containing protein n=1 Tax=Nocardia sp. bgisy134 TaxID=3413789 RepID=UPI003D7523C7